MRSIRGQPVEYNKKLLSTSLKVILCSSVVILAALISLIGSSDLFNSEYFQLEIFAS